MSVQESGKTIDIRGLIEDSAKNLGSKSLLEGIVLPKIDDSISVVKFLHRYQLFNGNFAAGVSCLAGAFHMRNSLFRDLSIPVMYASDRSARIASYIYFAAEDEYADRDSGIRVTHRDLGQFVFNGACKYFDINLSEFDSKYPANESTLKTLASVHKGYCLDQKNDEETILRGLGFHIGSELLADQEFNLIDNHLRAHFPGLVKFLEEEKTEFGNSHYHWIKIHTFVELEHLDHAYRAAQMAIDTYCGTLSKRRVSEIIVDGFLGFGDMQKYFFSKIMNDTPAMSQVA